MTESNTYNKGLTFKDYLAKTFSTVAIGVSISAILAYLSSKIAPVLIYKNPQLAIILSLALVIGELAVAFYFSLRLNKMSKQTAWFCYILYSVLTGLSFASIVLSYTDASVTLAFVATAIMFACMSFIGHTSNIDYTKVYVLFLPAVIAGFIVTLLNMFIFHSSAIDMMVVYIGIVLFLLITAADVQKCKQYYYQSQGDNDIAEKLMIMSAFQLYLDFANLFIRILQIFGRRRND